MTLLRNSWIRLPDEKIIYPDKDQTQDTIPENHTENNKEPEVIDMFPPEPPVCKSGYADKPCNDKQEQNEFIISFNPIGFSCLPEIFPFFHLQSFADRDPSAFGSIIDGRVIDKYGGQIHPFRHLPGETSR